MKRIVKCIILNLFVLLLGNPSSSYAQINLVPNPSFEMFDTCISYSNVPFIGINSALPWFQPCTIINSSDYFNVCNLDTNDLSVPKNYEGYQIPRTGSAYAGIATGYIVPQNNYREYLEVKLTDSLELGKKYCVSFFVNHASYSKTSIDGLGLLFSATSIISNNPPLNVLPLSPQIQNTVGSIISDTLNWTEIVGEYYSLGGEKYITIGNFKDDANTSYIRNSFGTHLISYYYIDDVSVILCDSNVGINENEWIKSFTISPNPAQSTISLNNLTNSVSDIFIYDLQGKILYKEADIDVLQNKHEINISNLSAGVYFVKVVTNLGIVSRKIVKN